MVAPIGKEHSRGSARSALEFCRSRSEEHTSELQSRFDLVCRLLRSTTSTSTLSLHDALPIFHVDGAFDLPCDRQRLARGHLTLDVNRGANLRNRLHQQLLGWSLPLARSIPAEALDLRSNFADRDRKSTRLNSSHVSISYAVFCAPQHLLPLFPYTTLFRSSTSMVPSTFPAIVNGSREVTSPLM